MPALASLPDPTVIAAKAGDASAWARLLAEHGPRVYAICRRLDPSPDDAYQEVWEKVLCGLDGYEEDGRRPFRSWLTTVTHRHLVDRYRRRAVRSVVVSLAEPPERGNDEPGADDALESRRSVAHLEVALAALPEPARRVIVMHHLHGAELSEIAAVEGVALGTIKSRLHRARARLLAALPSDLLGDLP